MTPGFLACRACGREVKVGKKVCLRCGTLIAAARPVPPPTGRKGWDKSRVKLAKFWR